MVTETVAVLDPVKFVSPAYTARNALLPVGRVVESVTIPGWFCWNVVGFGFCTNPRLVVPSKNSTEPRGLIPLGVGEELDGVIVAVRTTGLVLFVSVAVRVAVVVIRFIRVVVSPKALL